jgi:hypothetical protein
LGGGGGGIIMGPSREGKNNRTSGAAIIDLDNLLEVVVFAKKKGSSVDFHFNFTPIPKIGLMGQQVHFCGIGRAHKDPLDFGHIVQL